MAMRWSIALLCCSAVPAQAAEPLITTDLLTGTYELLTDAYAFAMQKVPLEPSWARWQEMQQKAYQHVEKQFGPLPPAVDDAKAQAQAAFVQVKALAAEHTSKAYEPANKVALQIIDALEKAVPASKGLIRRSLGDLVIASLYFGFVMLVLVKVLFFFTRLALRILDCVVCGICCCRCCCRKQSKSKKPTNGKAAAKPAAAKPAATKPAAAKANGKKK